MKKIIFILFIYLLLISNVLAGEKSPANYIVNNCKFSELCTITYAELSAIVQDNVTKSNIQQFSITTEKDFPVIYKLTDIGINYIVPSETELYNNKDKIYDSSEIYDFYKKLNDERFRAKDGSISIPTTGIKVEIKFHLNKKPQSIYTYSIFPEKYGYIFPVINYYVDYVEDENGRATKYANNISDRSYPDYDNVTYEYIVGSQLGVISESSYIKFILNRDIVKIYLASVTIKQSDVKVNHATRGVTVTYEDVRNIKNKYNGILPATSLRYDFDIYGEDYDDYVLRKFLVFYTIAMPVFIGNCTLSGKVTFTDKKSEDGYIYFNIKADIDDDAYRVVYSSSSQYQKLNDDGTFLLKSIPDYEWVGATPSARHYLQLYHTLNAFDLDGNSGEIVDKKLTCEPLATQKQGENDKK